MMPKKLRSRCLSQWDSVWKESCCEVDEENGIKAKTKHPFKATTKSRHDFLAVDNLLNWRFLVDAANKVWVSAITFIWTREGWLYLAAILDISTVKLLDSR